MLWRKAWLETRGRFLGGLALSLIVGFGVIYDFSATERLLPLVRKFLQVVLIAIVVMIVLARIDLEQRRT